MNSTVGLWWVGFLSLFLTACPAAEPPMVDVAANWNGTISLPGGDPGLSLLTLSLEQFGTDIEGVAALGPVSETGVIGSLAGTVSGNVVDLYFSVVETDQAVLYTLTGEVADDVTRGNLIRYAVYEGRTQGTFELARER